MRKTVAYVLCVCLLLGLLCACGGDGTYTPTGDGLGSVDTPIDATQPQEQSVTLTYYPEQTLNPLLCTDYTNRVIISLMYQGLFAADREYHVQPMLCKSYRMSQDMRTYTFYLENTTFSDGKQLTNADVVASLIQAKNADAYGGRFQHILDIAVTEDGGVQISLDTAMENLPLLLDIPIVPEDQVESLRPAGTGPYILDESGSTPRLRRRTDWWCDTQTAVTASSITLLEARSNPQIRDNFQFGGLDLVCTDPGSDKFADYRSDYELWNCESGILLYLACSADSEVFANAAVRSALTFAIDRDSIAEKFYRGYAQPVTLPASPNFPYYNQNLAAKYAFDREKFTAAVQQAGFVGREVTLLVNSGDSLRVRVAREIAQMLTDCGLTVVLSELSGRKYTEAIQLRVFDIYLGQTALSPNMDLSPFFYAYGSLSYGGINEAGAYALCLEALANYGNYYSLYKYVMENGLLCPVICRSYAVFGTRGVFSTLAPARNNVFWYSSGKTMDSALLRTQ